jgi:NADH dehydrogenase FAD-containing subunit
VKETLQISDEKLGHIYAAGDVADIDAAKNGRAATMQAMHVAKNIVRAIQGKELLDYCSNTLIEGGIELTLGLVSCLMFVLELSDAYCCRKIRRSTSPMGAETLSSIFRVKTLL